VGAESGPHGWDAVAGPLTRVLGVPAGPEQVCRIRAALHSRRVLLVLDGVTDPKQVRPLVTIGGASAVIVVTPRPLAIFDGIWTIHVSQ
jgi:hypothetical protein